MRKLIDTRWLRVNHWRHSTWGISTHAGGVYFDLGRLTIDVGRLLA